MTGARPVGTLYLVATPIGNLEDVTLRALRVLGEVQVVLAEDTRTARKLLSHHKVRQARVLSYNEHNMKARTPQVIAALREGDVALVSEAGTPAISDPGYELVRAAIEAGFAVSPVPGASAVPAALAVSGLPGREFVFLGFLPRRQVERRRLFRSLVSEKRTLVAFESPHRVLRTLEDMRAAWGERRVAVCREMTKLHEEIFRGTLGEALAHFAEPRGEFTLVIEGAGETAPVDDATVERELRRLTAGGASARDAIAAVAKASGRPRREVYAISLAMRGGSRRG